MKKNYDKIINVKYLKYRLGEDKNEQKRFYTN